MMKILSFLVAFLENMNFMNTYLSMNYEIGISESNWGIETSILGGL